MLVPQGWPSRKKTRFAGCADARSACSDDKVKRRRVLRDRVKRAAFVAACGCGFVWNDVPEGSSPFGSTRVFLQAVGYLETGMRHAGIDVPDRHHWVPSLEAGLFAGMDAFCRGVHVGWIPLQDVRSCCTQSHVCGVRGMRECSSSLGFAFRRGIWMGIGDENDQVS